ncbi:uncharacterized protein B0H18DRAFT_964845 [Fomitopsis serialis]|uniref:uncharacterized protein n=2 Tax=Fomitopsis serialis TaxID=139415 RepID=UPI0020083931|nr:uncharacterized protein B0H18DRAFT_964845 [Neoantrodia serialis]KAH9905553.1 hypothetical protein B0H18DRAFT_964845 [Neoantrodia serialis]
MRVVFATAWFALLTAGTVVLFGAEPVSASTTTNFGGQASPVHLRESSGAVDKAHNGMNSELETPQQFWEHAQSLGHRSQDYAAFLIHEAAQKADAATVAQLHQFQYTIQVVVSNTEDLKELIAQTANKPFDEIQRDIEKVFEDLLEELKEQFPPHDQAPNHAERRGNVSLVVRKAEEAFIKLGVQYGMPEKQLRKHLDPIMKHVEDIVVIIGDSAEQHPVLFKILIISGIMLIIPESWFLRPLFRLFGMSPEGPVAGSTAAWAQRVFCGAYIPKGSWFSHLQHAAMKSAPLMNPVTTVVGSIMVGVGIAGEWFT